MAQKTGMDRHAVIRTYGTKELHKWSQMNSISSKGYGSRVWIGGMDQEYGSLVGPGYGSGPYILSCSHIYIWYDCICYQYYIILLLVCSLQYVLPKKKLIVSIDAHDFRPWFMDRHDLGSLLKRLTPRVGAQGAQRERWGWPWVDQNTNPQCSGL